jgi:hypothetical protein
MRSGGGRLVDIGAPRVVVPGRILVRDHDAVFVGRAARVLVGVGRQ